jgi:hypothetical protein
MTFPVKQVRTLEEEVEKNRSEKRIDVVKRLGLPPSTVNTIIMKKRRSESAHTCLWTRSLRHVVCCVEEMCGELGSGSCVEEVQGGGGEDTMKPSPNQWQVLQKHFVRLSP